jgi:hypothetical protein
MYGFLLKQVIDVAWSTVFHGMRLLGPMSPERRVPLDKQLDTRGRKTLDGAGAKGVK